MKKVLVIFVFTWVICGASNPLFVQENLKYGEYYIVGNKNGNTLSTEEIMNDDLPIIDNINITTPKGLKTISLKYFKETSRHKNIVIDKSLTNIDLDKYALIDVNANLLKRGIPDETIQLGTTEAKEKTHTIIALVGFMALYCFMWIGKVYA